MSRGTAQYIMLSEWRTIMISQTMYPIMPKHGSTPLATANIRREPQWRGTAEVQIPQGHRVLTKWQEQVRAINSEDDLSESNHHWYVVREWTEAEL